MTVTLRGTSAECAESVKRLSQVLTVVEVSRQYEDRGTSRLVRVYVEVRL